MGQQMKNVFEIRSENENYVVLPTDISYEGIHEGSAVIIFLYYLESLENYCAFIDPIVDRSGEIDLFIITTSDDIERIVRSRYENLTVIRKENRGRDVSALLVAASEITRKYKYFCFVHDKKVRKTKFIKDFDLWIRNMWENTIGSRDYIRNVIEYFQDHEECGLLIPPEPFGDYYSAWFSDSWYYNYDITYELSQKLQIHADINPVYPPISLGTVFWARTDALKKLLLYPWKYSDFMEEPLPYDGTVSHAIERVLPYVAYDAGYETKTVMTSRFCATLLSFLQTNAFSAYSIMRKYLEIVNVQDMKNLIQYEEKLPAFFISKKSVYLYGAGNGGRACFYILRIMGLRPKGFIVSENKPESPIDGIPVTLLSETDLSGNCGVIITVINYDSQMEIIKELDRYPNVEYIVWHDLGM